MPSGRPITNSGCGVGPLYSRTSAIGCVALPGDAPAGPVELALLEVADGVRGVEPVVLEEGAQQRPVRGGPGDHAARAGRARPWPSADLGRRPGGADARPAQRAREHRRRSRMAAADAPRRGRPVLEGRADDALLGHDPGDQLGRA